MNTGRAMTLANPPLAQNAKLQTSAEAPRRWNFIAFRSMLGLVVLGVALWAIYQVRDGIFILLISGLVASALHPAINWLTARGVPRKLSIGLVFLLFVVLAATLIFVIGGILLDQGRQFIEHLPAYENAALEQLKTIPHFSGPGNVLQQLSHQAGSVAEKGSMLLFSSLAYILGFFKSALDVFTILIFSFFLLADTEYFRDTLYNLLPWESRDRTVGVLSTISLRVGAYVRGQLIVVSLTGVLVAIGLTLLHIPYAYVLGILVAILDIMPVVGPLIAIIFGAVVTLGYDPSMLPWVVLVYVAAQQIENVVVFPFVMGKSVNIHPSWILLSIFLLSLLIGVAGVVLAVPTAITVNVLLQEYYVDGYLKKQQPVRDIEPVAAKVDDQVRDGV